MMSYDLSGLRMASEEVVRTPWPNGLNVIDLNGPRVEGFMVTTARPGIVLRRNGPAGYDEAYDRQELSEALSEVLERFVTYGYPRLWIETAVQLALEDWHDERSAEDAAQREYRRHTLMASRNQIDAELKWLDDQDAAEGPVGVDLPRDADGVPLAEPIIGEHDPD